MVLLTRMTTTTMWSLVLILTVIEERNFVEGEAMMEVGAIGLLEVGKWEELIRK
jgi:hypothetical protein